ncbi:hypothetical protein H072_3811 [Dactylellina haptotyla CBS 200.50]|uniref:Caspase family p20 domain-containing protein n=1 Tax=Dactylellina haptotyla (strain CBS 200.50) TaxID=1284197 RepID=S8AGS2_DACHA|nr:hypothetical protein H072_3811 [Dactylellina haptotyla CBS 200.50]
MASQAASSGVTTQQQKQADFLRRIEEAIQQRDDPYKLVFAVTMVFESDDTGAKADSELFAKGVKEVFGLIDANIFELVFPSDGEADLHWLSVLKEIQAVRHSCTGRKLLLLHFAGHGALDSSNQLLLVGNPTGWGQELPWDTIKNYLLNPSRTHPQGEMDIACVLDCCHSGAFASIGVPSNKRVEVLAAIDARSTTVERRTQDIQATFTQQFIYCLRTMVGKEDQPPVTFPDIFKEMVMQKQAASKPQPVYQMISGDCPILLPVTSLQLPPVPSAGPSNPRALDSWRTKPHSVALKVRIPGDINEESTRTIVKWLYKLRKDYGIEVMGVNETTSTVVFLTVPYRNLFIFYRLKGMELCTSTIICHNIFSENLLHNLAATDPDEAISG